MKDFAMKDFADIDCNKPEKYPEQEVLPGLPCDYRKARQMPPKPPKSAYKLGLALLPLLLVGTLLGVLGAQPDLAGAVDAGLPFRLHIVANSDSAHDQTVKLQVRDAVVEYLTPLLAEAESREQAEQIVLGELPQLEALASGICGDFGYTAVGEVGEFDFPPKRYGRIMLPAGKYRALRLNLGAAEGHNWWCVLFPPLCFVDECGEVSAGGEAADESLIYGDRVVRLKMCEIFNKL